jgi:hypothetical protein
VEFSQYFGTLPDRVVELAVNDGNAIDTNDANALVDSVSRYFLRRGTGGQ